MKYHIIDGNNIIHRYIHSNAFPLKRFVDLVRTSHYPIIVWDGINALTKRREIFPEYKMQRDRSKSSIAYEVMDVARELADNLDCIQVRVTGAEADDVVAHMVETLKPENVAFIHSNDIDLAGFGVPTMYTQTIPDHLKLYKTLVGKSSDNVKGLKLFGPKSWEKLDERAKLHIEGMLQDHASVYLNDDPPVDEKLYEKLLKNLAELKVLWQISNFVPIGEEELNAGTSKGTVNDNNIEMIRKEYLLWNTGSPY